MRFFVATILLAIPTLANAQDTYTLKVPPQAKGDVQRVEFGVQQTFRALQLDNFGTETREGKSYFSSKLIYVDQNLEVEKGEVTRFRRKFETARQAVNDADSLPLAIHGKTLIIECRDGKKHVTSEDGEPLSETVAREFEEVLKAGKDKLGNMASFEPLPNRPVKVGESWEIDISAIVKDCESKHACKLTGATGTGTLKEIVKGPKGPAARVEVHIRVPLTTIKTKERVIELNEGSGTTLDATYDLALGGEDNSYASNMQLKFLAIGSNPEPDGTATRLRIELTAELKESRTK